MAKLELRGTVGDRERRVMLATAVAIRAAAEGKALPTIEGHGALFNEETVIYGMFRERILPGAFKDSIAEDDIRVAFNHSPNCILGRTSAQTATIEEDDKGLRYTAEPPDTTWARDCITSIQRRDITGSSFQFTVEKDADEEWDFSETKKGKLPLRTIKRARLYETGPVAFPAYENTTVSARAIDKVEEARHLLDAARHIADPVPAAAQPAPADDGAAPADAAAGVEQLAVLERELDLEALAIE